MKCQITNPCAMANSLYYCAFHKLVNSKVQKLPSQLRFSLPSIIMMVTRNEPWNTETHKTDQNPPITNHKPWPFEPIKLTFCFLRGPLRWLTAAIKCNCQLAFELQNLHVCEKRSIKTVLKSILLHNFVSNWPMDTVPFIFC